MAQACGVSDAKVISTFRYHDGYIFVNFDKVTNCDCSQNRRLAFRGDDINMDYVKSMILLSYTTKSPISAYASSDSCSVHGNTAKLTMFSLKSK